VLGPIELDGPYIVYNDLNAKLPGHLRVLPLKQAEELVNHLAALPEAQEHVAWRDYLHEEMALIALCRDNHGVCRRHKERMTNPAAFIYDQPLNRYERKIQKTLLGNSRGSLNARLNFQRIRGAMRWMAERGKSF